MSLRNIDWLYLSSWSDFNALQYGSSFIKLKDGHQTCKIVQLPWSLMKKSKHDGLFGHKLNWLGDCSISIAQVISYCSNINCDWKLHNNGLESVISGWGRAGSLVSHIYPSRLRGGWSTRDSLLNSKAPGTDCSHLDMCFYKSLSLTQHLKSNLETPDGQNR